MHAIGRDDLVTDPDFATNAARVQRVDDINDVVQSWFSERTLDEAMAALEAADVPAGPVRTMADVVEDPHLAERDSLVSLPTASGPLRQPGLVPKFSRTPGAVRAGGPALGADTDTILGGLLGYSPERIDDLRTRGVV